jgi:hypothetical protein
MRHRHTFFGTSALFLGIGLAVTPIHAHAVVDEPQKASGAIERSSGNGWVDRPFGMELRLGVATPTGAVGLGVDYSPIGPLSLECGVGTNFIGPEAGCGARARAVFASGRRAMYLGVGVSGGPHSQTVGSRYGAFSIFVGPMTSMGHSTYTSHHFDMAYWTNVELGYETRRRSGSTFRAYGGAAFLMNPDDAVMTEPITEYDKELPLTTTMLYGGVAFGYAL